MNIICIIFGFVFSFAGIMFSAGKLYSHIPAWKEMSDSEKEKINIVPLCRNIGFMIFLSGLFFLADGLWPFFQKNCFTPVMIAWLIAAGFDVMYIGKSRRYNNREHKH